MGDEIRQPRNIGQVHPLNRSRDAGERKRPRQPVAQRDEEKRRHPRRDGDDKHQVDEYV